MNRLITTIVACTGLFAFSCVDADEEYSDFQDEGLKADDTLGSDLIASQSVDCSIVQVVDDELFGTNIGSIYDYDGDGFGFTDADVVSVTLETSSISALEHGRLLTIGGQTFGFDAGDRVGAFAEDTNIATSAVTVEAQLADDSPDRVFSVTVFTESMVGIVTVSETFSTSLIAKIDCRDGGGWPFADQ